MRSGAFGAEFIAGLRRAEAEEQRVRASAAGVLAEMLAEAEGGDLEGARVIENATKDKAHGIGTDRDPAGTD